MLDCNFLLVEDRYVNSIHRGHRHRVHSLLRGTRVHLGSALETVLRRVIEVLGRNGGLAVLTLCLLALLHSVLLAIDYALWASSLAGPAPGVSDEESLAVPSSSASHQGISVKRTLNRVDSLPARVGQSCMLLNGLVLSATEGGSTFAVWRETELVTTLLVNDLKLFPDGQKDVRLVHGVS